MGLIIDIIESMSPRLEWVARASPILKSAISIQCTICQEMNSLRAEAAYRQYKRGNRQYRCRLCASIKWDNAKRTKMSKKSINNWKNPEYAGTIIGKAMAKSIIDKIENG